MGIIGFNFLKIDVEKKKAITGKVNIKNNVTIKSITEKDINFADDQSGIQFNFEYSSTYEPDLGHINLNGEVIYLEKKKKVQEILNNWKKNKKVDKPLMTQILNNVLMKCNIQSLILSQNINLPPPIPLPKVGTNILPDDTSEKKQNL